jgi:hypothetical protein
MAPIVTWGAESAAPVPESKAPAAAPGPAKAGEVPSIAIAGSDAQFFAELGYKDVADARDTARALMVLLSEDPAAGTDFEAARKFLREKGVLPDGWLDKAKPEDPIDKGHLASLICRALGIKGGLAMHLFGPVPRYALSECLYLQFMARGADYVHVTGGELVGVIDRADRFRQKQAGQKAPVPEKKPRGAVETEK